jgi:oligopeptide/dipeptide ABC transporter ATP-binding protein
MSVASLAPQPAAKPPEGVRPLLRVENLTLRVPGPKGPLKALDDFSLDIAEGAFVGLVGESGSGKSMLARAIMRLLPDELLRIEGRILLDGVDVTRAPERDLVALRGGRMSMIFQEPMTALDPLMRVEDAIAEAIDAHRRVSGAERRDEIHALLEAVRFDRPDVVARLYPHELSGGMRQRVMIAMALANKPRLLIADEPTTALDVTIQKEILEIIGRLGAERRLAVLFISHDLSLVRDYADRLAVLYGGVAMETGPARAVIAAPRHPYTAALLRSLPGRRLHGRGRGIEGSVPGVDDWFEGCRFAPRCVHVTPACRSAPVAMREVAPDRASRCVFDDAATAPVSRP